MHSLGKVIRGLSALFWGLPITLILSVQTAKTDLLRHLGILPPLFSLGILLFGLMQLVTFQKQERIWQRALERSKLFAIINIGLAPNLFWWRARPNVEFFSLNSSIMVVTGIIFIFLLNETLRRLAAMLPDETLRTETGFFTAVNQITLCGTLIIFFVYLASIYLQSPPAWIKVASMILHQGWSGALVIFVILPVAITMALIWKTKETVLNSVFKLRKEEIKPGPTPSSG